MMSEPEVKCLDSFLTIRNKLAIDLNLSDDEIKEMISFCSKKFDEVSTLELFVAEVSSSHIVITTTTLFLYIYIYISLYVCL